MRPTRSQNDQKRRRRGRQCPHRGGCRCAPDARAPAHQADGVGRPRAPLAAVEWPRPRRSSRRRCALIRPCLPGAPQMRRCALPSCAPASSERPSSRRPRRRAPGPSSALAVASPSVSPSCVDPRGRGLSRGSRPPLEGRRRARSRVADPIAGSTRWRLCPNLNISRGQSPGRTPVAPVVYPRAAETTARA
jgi:hypothetical protein